MSIKYLVLYGALGDAYGAGPEMKSSQEIAKLDLDQYHLRDKLATGYRKGLITDDTWMSIALMRTLMTMTIDVENVENVEKYVNTKTLLKAYTEVYNEETKYIRDRGYIGPDEDKGSWWGQIALYIENKKTYEDMQKSMSSKTGIGLDQTGNGSLMRAMCLGSFKDISLIKKLSYIDSKSTHDNQLAIDGEYLIAMLANYMLYKEVCHDDIIKYIISVTDNNRIIDYLTIIDTLPDYETEETLILNNDVHKQLTENNPFPKIQTSGGITLTINEGNGVPGFVLYTLGAVLHVLKCHKKDTKLSITLKRLILLGGDTDSFCSMGLSVLGARYGSTETDDINKELLLKLEPNKLINKIAEQFSSFIQNYNN